MLLLVFVCFRAQEKSYVLIDVQTGERVIRKDSLSASKFLDSLALNRFFLTKLVKVEQDTDGIRIFYDKVTDFNRAKVVFSDSLVKDLNLNKELFINNLDSLRENLSEIYRQKGFVFNRIKTQFLTIEKTIPKVSISVVLGDKRIIGGFVLKGYDKAPVRFVKNLNRDFFGKVYDDNNLQTIHNRLKNHQFIKLERPPQTLFTKDSTRIFLFLQKKKVNSFDGVLGFGNNSFKKISLNGSIDLNFQNIFNGFERINLFWQRSPNNTQNFDLQTDVPYVLKSDIGTNLRINIYRQDSTFANVKLLPGIYYNLSTRQKLGIRGNFEQASAFNENTVAKNFNRKGLGLWYEFVRSSDTDLMLYKTKIRAEADVFSTVYDTEQEKHMQQQYFISAEHNFHLLESHYLNMKGEVSSLNAKNHLSVNELLHFGGWNSLRGFSEQSLIGNLYAFGGLEYRYLIGKQAFFDVFYQLAFFENKSLAVSPKLHSLGLGFNVILPIGLMSFQISNGIRLGEAFRFGETKIHWGILTRF